MRTGRLVREALSTTEGPDDFDRWTLHDLRRTCRTGLSGLKPAIPLEVKEAVLNHAKEGLVRTYDLYDFTDEKRDALQRWADRVRDIVAPPPDNVISLATGSDFIIMFVEHGRLNREASDTPSSGLLGRSREA